MTTALDLGSSEFRSLRRQGDRLIARRLPAEYTVVDDTPAHRRLLEQSHLPFSAASGTLIVMGEAASEVATLLSRPVVPLLAGGALPESDPVARQVCAAMIESLLPAASHTDELCYLSIPRGAASSGSHETPRFLEHVVQLLGYRTAVGHPATALAFAELEDEEFTGACLTLGAECITFSLTHLSQPIVEARFMKGSREVVNRFAHTRGQYLWDHRGNSYVDAAQIESWLRKGDLSLASPQSDEDDWFADAYSELLLAALFSFKRKLVSCDDPILRQPLPVVISGGACRLSGMCDLVQESLRLSGTPLRTSEVRLASSDPYSIARGLLIQATLESGVSVSESLAVVDAA